jgi:hypothetical protein
VIALWLFQAAVSSAETKKNKKMSTSCGSRDTKELWSIVINLYLYKLE